MRVKGKIGYLHLYAMGGGDIESFAREFYTNYDKDGLIIDVRRNRGGNIDSWIIDSYCAALRFGNRLMDATKHQYAANLPCHFIVLTDELIPTVKTSVGIKALGIAPLIGKQTAGAGGGYLGEIR